MKDDLKRVIVLVICFVAIIFQFHMYYKLHTVDGLIRFLATIQVLCNEQGADAQKYNKVEVLCTNGVRIYYK